MDYDLQDTYDDSGMRSGEKSCGFYDIWVSHDMSGLNFNMRAPITHTSEHLYAQNLPFQVFSCWNGMVAFAADIFQQQRVSFRRNYFQLGECAASETELLARDMWKLGRGKFAVSPTGASAYETEVFQKCTRSAQPKGFHHATPIDFASAPPEVSCCPLEEHKTYVDFSQCFFEIWDRFDVEGLPISKAGLLQTKGFAVGGVCAVLLAIMVTHVSGIHRSSPCMSSIWLVLSSSMLLDVLNQIVLAAMPLPLTLLAMQVLIASVLLLMSEGGIALVRELIEQTPSAACWCLIAPLSALSSVTSIFALQAGSSSLLLAMQNALPLAMLVIEPLVFPSVSGPTIRSLFLLNGVAVMTILYTWTLMRGTLQSQMTPALVVLNGVLCMARQLLLRHFSISRNIHLSFGARSLVDNLVGLVFIFPMILVNRDQDMLPSILSNIQTDVLTLVCIFFSGCASLCMGYYGNILQSKVLATTVMSLHTGKKVLMIFLALLISRNRLSLVNGSWCLLCLLGLLGYAFDVIFRPPGALHSGHEQKIKTRRWGARLRLSGLPSTSGVGHDKNKQADASRSKEAFWSAFNDCRGPQLTDT